MDFRGNQEVGGSEDGPEAETYGGPTRTRATARIFRQNCRRTGYGGQVSWGKRLRH